MEEKVLPDDYPVYWDYWYVVDGRPIKSAIEGKVIDLKADLRLLGETALEVKNCDIVGRMEQYLAEKKGG